MSTFQRQPRNGRRSVPRSHAIFESFEREIVLGTLPPNTVLLELDLADRFACSQSTVREVLLRLQEEGLVQRKVHRGTAVADCRDTDARELLRIRHDIEVRAVDRVLANCSTQVRSDLDDALEAMREAARQNDEYQLSVHDREFHLRLFSAADLPAVTPILSRCLVHNHRFKIIISKATRDLMETADRHVGILDALDSGDATALRKKLSHHIATVVEFGPNVTGESLNLEA